MGFPRTLRWGSPLVLGVMVTAVCIRGVHTAVPSYLPPDLSSPDALVVSTALPKPPPLSHAIVTTAERISTTPKAPAPVPAPKSVSSCTATGKPPVAIRIPSIGVSSRDVIPVGLLADQTIQTPPLSKVGELGWYQCSPVPGATGPSVVVAHDEQQRHHGLFWNLGQVRVGDEVDLDRSDGQTATFRVTQRLEFPKTQWDQYKDQIFGDTSTPQLRVITCSGLLSQEVVLADLVSLHPSASTTGGH